MVALRRSKKNAVAVSNDGQSLMQFTVTITTRALGA